MFEAEPQKERKKREKEKRNEEEYLIKITIIMVAFVELVQQTFRKFQLQFEIALIDRDITNRQRKFGIELYDLIEHQRQQVTADLNNEKVFFQTIENCSHQLNLDIVRLERKREHQWIFFFDL